MWLCVKPQGSMAEGRHRYKLLDTVDAGVLHGYAVHPAQ